MTFGSLFDNIFSMSGNGSGSISETTQLETYVSELDDAIGELNDSLADQNLTIQERIDLEQNLLDLQAERDIADQQYQDSLQANMDSLNNVRDVIDNLNNSLDLSSHTVLSDFVDSITDIIDAVTSGAQPIADLIPQISEAIGNLAGGLIEGFTESLSGGFTDLFKMGLGSVKKLGKTLIGGFAKSLGPFGPMVEALFDKLFDAIVEGLKQAYEQIIELNDELTKLMRQTGGLIKMQNLGYSKGGMNQRGESLKTLSIKQNVSVSDITDQISELTSGLGDVAGTVNFFAKENQKALVEFGVEAAKMKKYYNADIGPAVRGLISDFGIDVGSATNTMIEGIEAAKRAGLDPGKFAENMTQAVKQSGKLHFKDGVKGMKEMALYATRLGIEVDGVLDGITKMEGINDLFTKQQETQALGMHNLSQAMSKIYALQKQGLYVQASQAEQLAIIADLNQGLIDDMGQITNEGMDYLKGVGKSVEDIGALQKLITSSKKSGLSAEKLLASPQDLTASELTKRNKAEQDEMTFQERIDQLLGRIRQTFIDPLAQYLENFIEPLMALGDVLFELIGGAVQSIFDVVMLIMTPAMEVTKQIFAGLKDAFGPLISLIKNIREKMHGFMGGLKELAIGITKWLLVPFRTLGKIIGFAFGVISDAFGIVWEAISPVVDVFSELFGSLGDGSTSLLDGFQEVLDTIRTYIVPVIKLLMKPIALIAGMFKTAYDAIKAFIDGIMEFVDWVSSFFSVDTVGSMAEGMANNFSWDAALQGGSVPSSPAIQTAITKSPVGVSKEQLQNEQALQTHFPTQTAPPTTIVNVHTDWVGLIKHKSTKTNF